MGCASPQKKKKTHILSTLSYLCPQNKKEVYTTKDINFLLCNLNVSKNCEQHNEDNKYVSKLQRVGLALCETINGSFHFLNS